MTIRVIIIAKDSF